MKLILRHDTTGPRGHAKAGAVLDLPDSIVEHYLRHDLAVPCGRPLERATAPPAPSRATLPPPVARGGSWWELPDGRRVQGKKKAIAAWRRMQ